MIANQRRSILIAVFALLILIPGCLGLPGRSQPMTQEQKALFLSSFDEMTRMIEETFWDPAYLEECWGDLKGECRQQVEDANSADEARSAMRRLLASLEMSHFGVIPDSASQELSGSPSEGEAGMILRVSDGRAIVVRLEAGGAAEKAGIQPGDEILKVGERELAPRLKEWGESGSRYLPIQALQSACSGEPGTERDYLVRNAQEDRTVTLTFQPPSDDYPRGSSSKGDIGVSCRPGKIVGDDRPP